MLEKLEFDVSRDKDGGTIMRVVDSDDPFDITIEKPRQEVCWQQIFCMSTG